MPCSKPSTNGKMTRNTFLDRLKRPSGRVRAVLDTDTFNEIHRLLNLMEYKIKR